MKKLAEETLENYEKAVSGSHPPQTPKTFKEKKTQSFKAVQVKELTKTERSYYERKQNEYIPTDNQHAKFLKT